MEKVIDCPVCFDTDHCFEEMQKEFSSFMCFRCGYNSNTTFKYESNELKTAQLGATQLMNDVCFYDEDREIMWFPSIVNMGELGMIYPEGTQTNWTYKLAQVRKLTKKEQKNEKYKGHDKMLDVDNSKTFGQYEFLECCQEMGIVKDISSGS
tara:strand:+ start:1142 stop:1597 length:456 start_codon:yes stop_codon:yes gene_type:complete